jgi:2-polyprenyl-3-methyl-5-hydroxy-6-metoxy-1,4-benzoquinol methylase
MSLSDYLKMPVHLKRIYNSYKDRKFLLLDVGCGNHSASVAKKYFPECQYYGLDKDVYNNDGHDFDLMIKFYRLDLENNSLAEIPDNFFDVIIMNHVIEHIDNGIEVVESISKKIKSSGIIYIETPSVKSLSLPNQPGTLNFCDDETHKKLYNIIDVANVLIKNNFKIIKAGTRRDKIGIFFSPYFILKKIIKRESLSGFGIWDITGFAWFIYAKKK